MLFPFGRQTVAERAFLFLMVTVNYLCLNICFQLLFEMICSGGDFLSGGKPPAQTIIKKLI